MELTGKLVALGHIFELRPNALFVADIYDGNRIHHVFVRHPSHLTWHSTLTIGHDYIITSLKEDVIYKEAQNIAILHTSRSSQLRPVCKEEKYSDLSLLRKGYENLICYQGKVTAVIDEDLGFYMLDHRELLVLSYLLGLVADIPVPVLPPLYCTIPHRKGHNTQSLHQPPACHSPSSTEDSSHVVQKGHGQFLAVPHISRKPMSVGDIVTIYFGHRIQHKDQRFIICCGRSLARWESHEASQEAGMLPGKHKREKVSHGSNGSKRSVYTALDTSLYYNLGFKALWWMYDVQNSLVKKLCPDMIDEEIIKRRHLGKVPGILKKLLSACWKQPLNSRSLLLEFLVAPHNCVLMQDFQEQFCVPSIHDLMVEVKHQLHEIRNHTCKVWLHSIVDHFPQVGHRKALLCGQLTRNADGLIGIEDKSQFLHICLARDSDEDLDTMLGAVVAISGYQIVCEKFNYLMENGEDSIIMVYAMFEAINMFTLWICSTEDTSASSPVIPSFQFRVLAKSGMLYQESPHQRKFRNFFLVLAAVQETGIKRRRTSLGSTTKMLLRFLGQGTRYHMIVKEGSFYRVFLPHGTPNVLFKSRTVPWLHSLKEHFGTCDMVDLPEDSILEKASVEKPLSVVVSVSELLQREDSCCSGLVHVCGIVVERQHMTPRYSNEIPKADVNKKYFPDEDRSMKSNMDVNNFIGIPGNKILRVLLKDKKEPSDTIWAYFSFSTPSHTLQYSLGIIPEATVILEGFILQKSKQSGRQYLQSTLFSQVQLVGLPCVQVVVDSFESHQYLFDVLCNQKSKPVGSASSIFTFATISRILSVSIKLKCSLCQSEYRSNGCGFVGCHASEKPEIDSSAKVVVDDGTCTAILFFKDDLVQKLLMLSQNQWISLSDMLYSFNKELIFRSGKGDSDRQNTAEEKYFAQMCSSPQLLRSVAVKCRPFRLKDAMNNKQEFQMFVLGITNLKPHHKMLLKNEQ